MGTPSIKHRNNLDTAGKIVLITGGWSEQSSKKKDKTTVGRILVVDDNDAVRIVLRTILEPVGRLVEDVSSVTQALDVIDASNPSEAPLDLIITDFQMPGRSGLELVECIRLSTRRNIQSLPVLMLSSNTSDAFRADSIIAGVNILMYKPFRSDRLLIAVEMLLTGR